VAQNYTSLLNDSLLENVWNLLSRNGHLERKESRENTRVFCNIGNTISAAGKSRKKINVFREAQ
jgi:hypothetical protein